MVAETPASGLFSISRRLDALSTSYAIQHKGPVQAQQLRALDDLVRGFLLSKRAPKTRGAYAPDLASWLSWCQAVSVDVLAAGIHHADAYLRLLAERV